VASEEGSCGSAVTLSDGIIARIDVDCHGFATVLRLKEGL
jgi:hypothetical protein